MRRTISLLQLRITVLTPTHSLPCYGPLAANHTDILDFFSTAILYYRRFPTWGWLNAAGIAPSNSTGYSTSALQTALTKASGAVPYLGCSGPRYNATAAGKGSQDNGYYPDSLSRRQ